jgi:hypothetical protein
MFYWIRAFVFLYFIVSLLCCASQPKAIPIPIVDIEPSEYKQTVKPLPMKRGLPFRQCNNSEIFITRKIAEEAFYNNKVIFVLFYNDYDDIKILENHKEFHNMLSGERFILCKYRIDKYPIWNRVIRSPHKSKKPIIKFAIPALSFYTFQMFYPIWIVYNHGVSLTSQDAALARDISEINRLTLETFSQTRADFDREITNFYINVNYNFELARARSKLNN